MRSALDLLGIAVSLTVGLWLFEIARAEIITSIVMPALLIAEGLLLVTLAVALWVIVTNRDV